MAVTNSNSTGSPLFGGEPPKYPSGPSYLFYTKKQIESASPQLWRWLANKYKEEMSDGIVCVYLNKVN